jgi:uncharacterized protein involved in type VI secretion and phage assembly
MSPHQPGDFSSLHLGWVIDDVDPEQRGRVQVSLAAIGTSLWASVVVPAAGHGFGVSMIPRIGDMVVLGFIDPEHPLVLGSVWSGNASSPLSGTQQARRYLIRSPAGVQIEIDDDGPSIELSTPGGARVRLDDAAGGSITAELGGQTVTAGPSGITVRSSGTVEIEASMIKLSAGMVQVEAGISRFSGVVQADTVITNAVISSSYTPGAGNIW